MAIEEAIRSAYEQSQATIDHDLLVAIGQAVLPAEDMGKFMERYDENRGWALRQYGEIENG